MHVNVSALLQKTAAAITRWADLQQAFEIESDTATTNLAAQAQTRAGLKRDLTDLTQLADAQTKHVQRAKMRHMQAIQAKSTGQATGQVDMASGQPSIPGGAGMRSIAAGGGSTHSEARGYHQHGHNFAAVGATTAAAHKAVGPTSSHVGPLVGVPPSHGGALRAAPSTSATSRQGLVEDSPVGQGSDWPVATRPGVFARSPSPPLPVPNPSQAPSPVQAKPLQQRLREVKVVLDRTDPRNKWAVLIEAALGLLPHEGPTYKHFFSNALVFLNRFNGGGGVEVAQALRTCMDPRVLDPEDITRSQQRLADVYAQWTRRGQG